METNKTDNYSVFMRKEENGYAIKINDEAFMKYFPEGAKAEVEPYFVEDDLDALNIPDSIDCSLFRNKMWEEYSQRCIACGRCNTSCPTCTCFTVQDIAVEDNMQKSERQRIWSSCQVKNFSLLAGDHDFRIPKGDRMRYKVLHKIVDFRKKFGFNMCVGCGRCDQVCPEYISMAKCIKKINEICIADREEKLW
jgi:anaerobic sulfite reductase subunit A